MFRSSRWPAGWEIGCETRPLSAAGDPGRE